MSMCTFSTVCTLIWFDMLWYWNDYTPWFSEKENANIIKVQDRCENVYLNQGTVTPGYDRYGRYGRDKARLGKIRQDKIGQDMNRYDKIGIDSISLDLIRLDCIS